MDYQPETLYYSNPDRARGARVTRDMMQQLCSALGHALDEEGTRRFIGNTRIPNERELYGLVVKALFSGELGKRVGHVATEVQVARKVEDTSGKGRVDIIFDYRGTSFLVELKVIRASVNGRGMGDEEATPTERLVGPWRQAVDQLRELDVESLGQALKRKVVKLPMAMYLHVDRRQNVELPEWQACAAEVHHNIVTHLQVHGHHDDHQGYHFSYFQPLAGPVTTSSRSGCLVEGTPDVKLYGFSIIAGMPETQGV